MTLIIQTGSIQRRLAVQLSIVAGILSFTLFMLIQVVAERAAMDTQDNILKASAASIADALYTENGIVTLELPYSALSMLGTISQDRVFYRVLFKGETLTGYDDLPLQNENSLTNKSKFSTFRYKGEEVRSISLKRSIGVNGAFSDAVIIVAQTRLGLNLISQKITRTATAIGVVFFLFGTGLSVWAANIALTPLNRIAIAVSRRGPKDLRPVTGTSPLELKPLVDALNSFILRLKSSLLRSEDFISEAAHRVRTPLATVRTQAEVIHRSLNKSKNKTALREMIRAIDESSRSAGQLLDHAMVNFRADQFEVNTVNLPDLVRDVCERLSPLAGLKDIVINIQSQDSDMSLQGDTILLQNALRNILDNAIKYSPDDSEISVNCFRNENFVISFQDSGRGFSGIDHTDRFTRGTNVGDVIGSGLGLTIANEVAIAHGGSLLINDSKKGVGSCVSLVLPI